MIKMFRKAKGMLFGLSGIILVTLPGCSIVTKLKAKQHPAVFVFSVISFFVIVALLLYIAYKKYQDGTDE